MSLLFAFPGNEAFAEQIGKHHKAEQGEIIFRRFPDQESYIKIVSDVNGKEVIVVCSLNHPDSKILGLLFFADAARELGATSVKLYAPYLSYMRQDKRFSEGEAITSKTFGALISHYFDELVTVDPHLHRYASLSEIYTIPTKVLHAADSIADWIKEQVKQPLVIGPDAESKQWAKRIADGCNAPFVVLAKKRHGDRDVSVTIPEIERYHEYTPVLVDDIISTATTMRQAVKGIHQKMKTKPVCIGIHALFVDNAYNDLRNEGVDRIVTCNTVMHESNGIDVSRLFVL